MNVWTPPSPVLDLVCPPRTDMLHLIRNVVATVSRTIGFSPEDTSLIEISVDEACTNVIRHAYGNLAKNAPTTKLEEAILKVEIRPTAKGLVISVIDHGTAPRDGWFRSVTSIEQYIAHPELKGLGCFIIHHFMDEVAYNTPPGLGTVLSMVKYLHQPNTL